MGAEQQRARIERLLAGEERWSSSKAVDAAEREQVEIAVSSSSMLDAFKLEKAHLENKKLEQEVEKLKQEVENISQDRKERKKYGIRTFWLVVAYLGVIFLFIFFAGICFVRLSDAVLIALITTLATNVLGLFYFVMKYLFSK